VHECQTPFFLATRVDEDGSVHLFFDAPEESPTVRGFAGVLYEGLEGVHWHQVLSVPPDFYAGMGLEAVVSPLRMRGMGAILARLKRQVREAVGL
jgi:cysteine desulfuration protein SufE